MTLSPLRAARWAVWLQKPAFWFLVVMMAFLPFLFTMWPSPEGSKAIYRGSLYLAILLQIASNLFLAFARSRYLGGRRWLSVCAYIGRAVLLAVAILGFMYLAVNHFSNLRLMQGFRSYSAAEVRDFVHHFFIQSYSPLLLLAFCLLLTRPRQPTRLDEGGWFYLGLILRFFIVLLFLSGLASSFISHNPGDSFTDFRDDLGSSVLAMLLCLQIMRRPWQVRAMLTAAVVGGLYAAFVNIGAWTAFYSLPEPIRPGRPGPVATFDQARDEAQELSYPVLVQAWAGGTPLWIQQAHDEIGLRGLFESARSEAKNLGRESRIEISKFVRSPVRNHLESHKIIYSENWRLHKLWMPVSQMEFRPAFPFDHHNRLANYMMMMVGVAAILLLWPNQSRAIRIAWLVAMLLFFATLELTKGRGAWLSLFAGVFAAGAVVYRPWYGRRHNLAALAFFAFFVCSFGLAWWSLNDAQKDRILKLVRTTRDAEETDWNIIRRQYSIQTALEMYDRHEWLGVGYGYHVFEELFPLFEPPRRKDDPNPEERMQPHAHMNWAQVAAEQGRIGLIAFFGHVVTTFLILLVAADAAKRSDSKMVWPLRAFMALFLMMFFYGFTNYALRYTLAMFYYLLMTLMAVLAFSWQEGAHGRTPAR